MENCVWQGGLWEETKLPRKLPQDTKNSSYKVENEFVVLLAVCEALKVATRKQEKRNEKFPRQRIHLPLFRIS